MSSIIDYGPGVAHQIAALPALRYVSDCSGGEGGTIGLQEIVGQSKAS
jgi:hypothetical protein